MGPLWFGCGLVVAIGSASDTLAASWIKQDDLGGRHFFGGLFHERITSNGRAGCGADTARTACARTGTRTRSGTRSHARARSARAPCG